MYPSFTRTSYLDVPDAQIVKERRHATKAKVLRGLEGVGLQYFFVAVTKNEAHIANVWNEYPLCV